MRNETSLRESPVRSETVYSGKILQLQRDTVLLPNGKTASRELIRHVGAVCVVPLTEENEVIVERQYRYPVAEVLTEIPAGKLDSKQEDRLEAARRELREETGVTADEMIDLGTFFPAAAYSDERITLYLARGLHFGARELDEDEFLDVERVPLKTLLDDVMAGKIPDVKTQMAILKIARYLGI